MPVFLNEAQMLDEHLKKLSPLQLKRLMHVSSKLAEATQERIKVWGEVEKTPAWYTFVGDVYTGLKIREFTKDDLEFAQQHLGTLSGLYGILKPLDLIHPYRLELGYKLKGSARRKPFKNLYEFWGDSIANTVAKNETVINLSSEEYIKVLRPYLKEEQIITPWFMQLKNDKPDFQAVHAKMARGAMARWISKNRINDPKQLKNFDYNGYTYSEKLSTPDKPTFTRPEGYDFRADY
jgi:cytoplasmic iron level regulating protein YaaA (DUF328/UPF0246 family)